ncbi:Fur family peroxide stress response transcriptional regulator [Desulfitispora alkaliphila]|uniref:Fur family transcriptional regulator n=1 Tax=Desulfitispora alkaliphila TaxID=622674 RepID=UPI003D21A2B6
MTEFNDLEEVYKRFKERGIRLTPQRRVILEYLKTCPNHPTAEEIYHYIKGRLSRVSLGTVYNTLHMLKETKVIQELSFGDLSSRYDGCPENHYHITCEKCGKVVDFNRPLFNQIEAEAEQKTDFVINTHRLELYGVCRDCQAVGSETGLTS